jgi:hypothetical protein
MVAWFANAIMAGQRDVYLGWTDLVTQTARWSRYKRDHDCYLVPDGHKLITALRQLGRASALTNSYPLVLF